MAVIESYYAAKLQHLIDQIELKYEMIEVLLTIDKYKIILRARREKLGKSDVTVLPYDAMKLRVAFSF
jgi:hypothetical protein